MEALREALAQAIRDVFLISFAAVVLTFIATLLLKEIPLQPRHRNLGVPGEAPIPEMSRPGPSHATPPGNGTLGYNVAMLHRSVPFSVIYGRRQQV